MHTTTIVRLPTVMAETGYGRSTVYMRIADGLLTPPISLGGRASGWPLAEIAEINRARIAGRTDNEIRELVQQLVAARRAAV